MEAVTFLGWRQTNEGQIEIIKRVFTFGDYNEAQLQVKVRLKNDLWSSRLF